jgi:hypothetical protein
MGTVRLLTVMLVGAALACHSPLSPSERQRLRVAQQRWAAREFADYSIEMQSSCFCPGELNSWASVEVVGGQISRVVLLSSGEVITDYRLSWWQTVEQLFAELLAADAQAYLDDVSFTIDRELGFPAFVRWTAPENVLDAGGTRTLRKARPLP